MGEAKLVRTICQRSANEGLTTILDSSSHGLTSEWDKTSETVLGSVSVDGPDEPDDDDKNQHS